MKKIEDYLHLYLGCDCMLYLGEGEKDQRIKLTIYNLNYYRSTLEDLKPILRPLSDMTEEEINECWRFLEWSENIKNNRRQKLNEEFFSAYEGRECGWFEFIKILPYLLSKSFDLFGLIDAGLALDKTKIDNPQKATQ